MTMHRRLIVTGVLCSAALLSLSSAAADDDLDTCRAGYKNLLMTPGECRTYLKELRAAQARNDHMAVLDLQEWHASLLIERAQACPCMKEAAPMLSPRYLSSSPSRQASRRF